MTSGCTSCWMGRHDLCENIRCDGLRALCCEGLDQSKYVIQRPINGARYPPWEIHPFGNFQARRR